MALRNFIRRIGPYVVLAVLLVAGGLVWWHREYLRDWWILRGYDPPAVMAQFADETAMTPYGKRLFLVNKPELNDKEVFNKNCEGKSTEAAVLGCYRGNRLGIYVYDVADNRLNGIEQVTAAHEMLHQAYDRLSQKERERIDALLEEYYQNSLTDESVKAKMETYKKTELEDLHNEMHSIFGTEIEALSSELETYYKQYFTDRSKVLAFNHDSQDEFDEYTQKIAEYDARLADLKIQIETAESDLQERTTKITTKRDQMNQDLASGQVGAYNAAVPGYNQMIKEFNQKLTAAKKIVESYNTIVAERNAIAIQVKSLNQALDSRLSPQ